MTPFVAICDGLTSDDSAAVVLCSALFTLVASSVGFGMVCVLSGACSRMGPLEELGSAVSASLSDTGLQLELLTSLSDADFFGELPLPLALVDDELPLPPAELDAPAEGSASPFSFGARFINL